MEVAMKTASAIALMNVKIAAKVIAMAVATAIAMAVAKVIAMTAAKVIAMATAKTHVAVIVKEIVRAIVTVKMKEEMDVSGKNNTITANEEQNKIAPNKKRNKAKRRSVQITITENCNLNCVYCYEKQKDLRVMPLEMVKQIMTGAFAEVEKSDKWDEIEFDFHGGEVALVFGTLKAACEWLWSEKRPKPYICFATTNGTLIHGEIKRWFCQNKNRFHLGMSLDGTPEMQNVNRSDSYDKIDFEFFRRSWPKQGVKMTISPQTLPTLADGIKHIIGLRFELSSNLAYGVTWDESLIPVYKNQLFELAKFYLDNPELALPNLLSMSMRITGLYNLKPERREERHKWCGSGDAMVCYGVDGCKYPCQVFMPSTHDGEQENLFEKFDFADCTNFEDEECAECVIKDACPACYGHNYIATGSLFKRPKDMCKFRMVEALAASYVQGKMLLDYKKYKFTRDLSDYERKVTAQGVKLVQTAFGGKV